MKTLYIDVETTSKEKDLKRCGAYRYAESARILLFGYAYDDGQPVVANGDTIPSCVLSDLTDPGVLKVAHNANFERTILSHIFGIVCDPKQWLCTAAWAAYAGLPRGLDDACIAAGLAGKPADSKRLIRKFCILGKPCEGTDWDLFKEYNRNDVKIERDLHTYLRDYPMPEREWLLWQIDQEINDRGFLVDVPFVKACVDGSENNRERLLDEARKISGLKNPNSVKQLKAWLNDGTESLDKETVTSKIKTAKGGVKKILEIRQSLAMSSVKKYTTLLNAVCSDGRMRGTLLYFGAHTGRWTGRLFQPQNLPRTKAKDPTFARQLILDRDFESLQLYFGDVEMCLSSMLRSAVIAPPDSFLRVDDFASIEARICAWLAGESWILDVFRADKPYYEVTASKLFGVPVDKITKDLRTKGKIASLALQYQGAIGALTRMGAAAVMDENQMLELVQAWRSLCPKIVRYWYQLNEAALSVGAIIKVGIISVEKIKDTMYIHLPSKRYLIYRKIKIVESAKTGMPALEYQTQKGPVQLYGGMLCENVVSAIARDLLGEYLISCRDCCVLHVHDEVVLEGKKIPFTPPLWCEGLPLATAGFDTHYYRKD